MKTKKPYSRQTDTARKNIVKEIIPLKKYDFKKARKIINVLANDLLRADMGIDHDWFCTAETVWSIGKGYTVNLSRAKELGGLQGSMRGTPKLKLIFKDWSEITIDCYREEK